MNPRLVLVLSLSCVGLAQPSPPTVVGQWERTLFKTLELPTTAVANPFAQVKLKAVFSHSEGSFEVPVVCTATTPNLTFPVYFAPPYQGSWTWTLEEVTAPGGPGVFLLEEQVYTFNCIASSARGAWRPGRPERYPFAVIAPDGTGNENYVWPMTTTHLHLADPRWRTFPQFSKYPAPFAAASTVVGGDQIILSALDAAASNGFNRIRMALNYSTQRGTENPLVPFVPPYLPAAANPSQVLVQYSVFDHNDATQFKFFQPGTWDPDPALTQSGIDFERFHLETWSHIDWIICQAALRGIHVAVTLTLNSGLGADFEDHYLANAATAAPGSTPSAAQLRSVITTGSRFQYRYELYYWYVVGRLCSYPNVGYTLMHEYDIPSGLCSPTSSNQTWGCQYPVSWVRWFGQQFASIEPYLSRDPGSKIVTTCPRRGSLYASRWGETPHMGFSENSNHTAFTSRLSLNTSAFLGVADRSWSSCIGLQRGGEVGLSSIVGSIHELYTVNNSGFWGESQQPVVGHRDMLEGAIPDTAPCPIFIEEDWIVDNTFYPWHLPAPSYNSLDNPYCVRPSHFLGTSFSIPVPRAGYPPNPYSLPGLLTNQEGIEKWTRDYVWGAGVVAGAFVSYWGPRYSDLSEPYNLFEPTISLSAYNAASRFCAKIDWWTFRFDQASVASQSPPVPDRAFQGLVDPGLPNNPAWMSTTNPNYPPPSAPVGPALSGGGTIQRPAIEAQVVASISTAGPVPRLIVYSPVTGTRGVAGNPPTLGPATVTLNLSGFPDPSTIQFLNPVTLDRTTPMTVRVPASNPLVTITPPAMGSPYLGPHNEYVLLVNLTIP